MKRLFSALVLLVCVLMVFAVAYDVCEYPFDIPLSQYRWDANFSGYLVKSTIENGWFLENERTGAPFGTKMYDFPMVDNLHFAIIKFFSIFSSDYAVVMNLVFLSGFILVAFSSFYVLKKYGVVDIVAIVCSVAYAFLPYHLVRGEGHLFLSMYFLVPLTISLVLDLLEEKTKDCDRFFDFFRKPFIKMNAFLILLVFAIGMSGIYYAFFTCLFLVFTSVLLSIKRRFISRLPLLLCGIIAFSVILNLVPNFMYWASHGRNNVAVNRSAAESEISGLKIQQLLIPETKSKLNPLSYFSERKKDFPLVNENRFSYLGIIGIIGFIYLLAFIFFSQTSGLHKNLARLNMFAVLVGTVGGAGTLIAILIAPEIRAYNRISIFIAFISIMSFSIVSQNILKGIKTARYRILYYVFFCIFGVWVISDQIAVSKPDLPRRDIIAKEYSNDAEFIKRVEAMIGQRKMVFQLPYMSFPENGPYLNKMTDYDHFKGYLHSATTRWSYGIVKGRSESLFIQDMAAMRGQSLVTGVSNAGYSGIYIDRYGYADNAFDLEKTIAGYLENRHIVSLDGRYSFWPIRHLDDRYLKDLKRLRSNEISLDTLDKKIHSGYKKNIDSIKIINNKLVITGWVILENENSDNCSVVVIVNDDKGSPKAYKAFKRPRNDVVDYFKNTKYLNSGFYLDIDNNNYSTNINSITVVIMNEEGAFVQGSGD